MLKELIRDERGAEMTEYILIIALIAVACVVVVKVFGGKIKDMFAKSTEKIEEQVGDIESY